ncbi:hypothetical protein PLICRDRAFT_252364 [Plicaturopsis crispa FD-325 SS-3]|nr:hypothetical protein PLICRDRAFT_252364 [Plicaturopsis crispa FD-325 SS-3]
MPLTRTRAQGARRECRLQRKLFLTVAQLAAKIATFYCGAVGCIFLNVKYVLYLVPFDVSSGVWLCLPGDEQATASVSLPRRPLYPFEYTNPSGAWATLILPSPWHTRTYSP